MGQTKDLAQRIQENGQAIQPAAALSPQDTIRTMIASNMNRIQQALPSAGVTPERLATIAFTAIRKTPGLMECEPASLIDCIIKSAELGLNPGLLGHAHMVPYGNQATFIIGYQGMLELARRSGQIAMIYAKAVYTEDQFSYHFGLHPDLIHVPYEGDQSKEWENVTHVYMVARFTNGGFHFGVMTKADVEKHRDQYAKGLNVKKYGELTSPWHTAPVPMALKTVIRQEWKFLPVSADVRQAVAEVEAREADVIEGRQETIWTRAAGEQMLGDGKPACEPEKPQEAEKPAAKAKDTKKKGEAAQAPDPEPVAPEDTAPRTGYCKEGQCDTTIQVTADATEEDLAGVVCGGCGSVGFTLKAPEVQATLPVDADK